ncbi:hypothetical protein NL676_034336 [Syzygium grande]|nr:hypothetical protein NL676_034336 [Syzygium grande]
MDGKTKHRRCSVKRVKLKTLKFRVLRAKALSHKSGHGSKDAHHCLYGHNRSGFDKSVVKPPLDHILRDSSTPALSAPLVSLRPKGCRRHVLG